MFYKETNSKHADDLLYGLLERCAKHFSLSHICGTATFFVDGKA